MVANMAYRRIYICATSLLSCSSRSRSGLKFSLYTLFSYCSIDSSLPLENQRGSEGCFQFLATSRTISPSLFIALRSAPCSKNAWTSKTFSSSSWNIPKQLTTKCRGVQCDLLPIRYSLNSTHACSSSMISSSVRVRINSFGFAL